MRSNFRRQCLLLTLFHWRLITAVANDERGGTTTTTTSKSLGASSPRQNFKDYRTRTLLTFAKDILDDNLYASSPLDEFKPQQEQQQQQQRRRNLKGSTILTATHISAGYFHTCATLSDNTLKCWGDNADGQLGLGDTINRGERQSDMGDSLPRTKVVDSSSSMQQGGSDNNHDDDVVIAQTSVGEHHSCALYGRGKIKCWGWNDYGQLGVGDDLNRGMSLNTVGDGLEDVDLGSNRLAKQISAGYYHNCALLLNDELKCWGYNDRGQLGLGDRVNRGDKANQMGDNLPSVDVGRDVTITSVSAGFQHTCVTLSDGGLSCWGYNGYGQLGLGIEALVWGTSKEEMGDHLPRVNTGSNNVVSAVSAGGYHTCAVFDDHKAKCWGNNLDGQLGLEDTDIRGKFKTDMGDNLPYVNLGREMAVKSISAGTLHTCAALINGMAKCWGKNKSGELGLVDRNNRGETEGTMGDDLPGLLLGRGNEVREMTAGHKHSCAVMMMGDVKCWGDAAQGRLGYSMEDMHSDHVDESLQRDDLFPSVDLGTV